MRNILLFLLISFPLLATDLILKDGYVAAHTEMMMSTIEPINNYLQADIRIQGNDITSIEGKFWVEMKLFTSDDADRDKNMYESVEADKYKLATFAISSVVKTDEKDNYTIDGVLSFHGVDKPLTANAKISSVDGSLTIEASSKILVSDFGIEPPCLIFMCVRDQIDLLIKASF